ncbi:pre-mrna-splicing factor atp-dependent rna helicase prp16-like [Haematococcus lacustris]|uniref:Pre-mrna-splicing factor atp-dependent rna helicase prp16-like n=1 Tax=Haematococcus lacustris TaxID=44745 RepID=A0A699Z3R9_HAELA|nr:pre-mrna-splicing factor atp-dependent rna helicase prp16-like [Haematococcus lacustris]
MSLAASKRASELDKDLNAWEENRLLTSGVARLKEINLDFDGEEENRVLLLVHDSKPPFLEGKVGVL